MLKVGDRVRCAGSAHDDPIGKTGVVLQLDRGAALCRFDEWTDGHSANDAEWWLCHDELVPAAEATGTDAEPKFKVGDRVKFRDDYNSSARGTEATVVSVDSWGIMVDGVHGKSTEQPSSLQHVPTTLRIEAGKFYRTRDGRKVGPMVRWREHGDWPWSCHMENGTDIWGDDGRNGNDDADLIAEWVDEPSDVFDELERWMAGNPQPANDNSTAGFTIPIEEEDGDIDELVLNVSVNSSSAESALDRLIVKLTTIDGLLDSIASKRSA